MEFEKSLKRLEEIKTLLEDANVSLDESIKLYEESVGLTKKCIDELKITDGKITVIKNELDNLIEKPLEIKED